MTIGDWPEALAALCVWREARGEKWMAKLGVAWVLKNRTTSKRWGTLDQVVLAPKQFSSFNANDVNATLLPPAHDLNFQDSLAALDEALYGDRADPTDGAMFYYSGKVVPKWAEAMEQTVQLGAFKFFREKS